MARSCLLVGATGLIGGHLLDLLLADPGTTSVTLLTRRPTGKTDPKLVEAVVDFDRPETFGLHSGVGDVFCCLGTTMHKAGSEEAFRKVDLEYPVAVAREASKAGAGQYLIVTAVGADPKSSLLYRRVKGEVEEAVLAISFQRGVKIFRPSTLLGRREESRPGERVGQALMWAASGLCMGSLARYRAIEAEKVARAMWNAARSEPDGTRVYEGKELFDLAAR